MSGKRTVGWIENLVWLFAAVCLAVFSVSEVLRRFGILSQISPVRRMGFLILICAVFYAAGLIRLRRTGDRRHMRWLMLLFALLYLYLLLHFTLTEETFGRGAYADREDARSYYLTWYVNFKPFRSIYQVYVKGYRDGLVTTEYVILNLLGNLCALFPVSVFLPFFFKSQRHWYFFLPAVILCACAIEGVQFWLMRGSCDVDDLILNAGGAFLLWWILRIPPVRRTFARFLGGDF